MFSLEPAQPPRQQSTEQQKRKSQKPKTAFPALVSLIHSECSVFCSKLVVFWELNQVLAKTTAACQSLLLILKSHQKPLSTAVQPLYACQTQNTPTLVNVSLEQMWSPVCVLSAHKFGLSRSQRPQIKGNFVRLRLSNLPRPVKLKSTCFTSYEHLICAHRSLIWPLDKSQAHYL